MCCPLHQLEWSRGKRLTPRPAQSEGRYFFWITVESYTKPAFYIPDAVTSRHFGFAPRSKRSSTGVDQGGRFYDPLACMTIRLQRPIQDSSRVLTSRHCFVARRSTGSQIAVGVPERRSKRKVIKSSAPIVRIQYHNCIFAPQFNRCQVHSSHRSSAMSQFNRYRGNKDRSLASSKRTIL